jgi:diguanylate cyclase (GGDEF)-like protein
MKSGDNTPFGRLVLGAPGDETTKHKPLTGERTLRILVVDDSEDDVMLLRHELLGHGIRFEYLRVDADSPMREALADDDWDIVICDHNMPGFDSLGALDVLKTSGKDIPFILYSGHICDEQAFMAMNQGVADYVPKGNIARLVPVIERELRGAAMREAVRVADDRIKELAFYDSLCALPNHNLFCARVSEWLLETERRGRIAKGALFYIDVDRFLRINSSFGYETGNELLRQVAGRLNESVETRVVLARLGADDFGIFFEGVDDEAKASAVGEWVLKAFDAPFHKDRLELYLTPSIGVSLLPKHGQEVYELLMNAETAMAVAKRHGGNGVRIYSREMNASSAERVALESALRHAVTRDELFLHYQPVVDSEAGRIVGVEALVRWQHPERGLIPPDRFIPIADESGLIVDIGGWVLAKACAQMRAWHEQGFAGLSVAVNVSAVQFGQPRLLEVVSRTLEESGLDPRCLMLEITEGVLMKDAETAVGMLRALKNMGVKIAVDDFGTGYSSLTYLKRFPIDVLKIDRSFVRDLVDDEDDAAIVRAIIALAKSLHLTTVAEGVETAEQASLLRTQAVERFQGYYFSRPLSDEKISEKLAKDRFLPAVTGA